MDASRDGYNFHVDCGKCRRDIVVRPRINVYHYQCACCTRYFHSFCVFADKSLSKRIRDEIDFFTCKSCFHEIYPFSNLTHFEFKRSFFINDIRDFESLPDLSDMNIFNDHDDPFHTFRPSPYISADKFHRHNFGSDGLSLMHVNLNSLNANSKDNLTTLLAPLKEPLHFLAITETRFSSKTDLKNFTIPGYKPLDSDLVDNSPTQAGGVVLYYQSLLNVIPRPDLKVNLPHLENVWVELIQPGNEKNIIIGVIYRHPRKIVAEIDEFTDKINETLLKINNESKTAFFCGDLNLNLIDYCENDHISNFVDMVYSNSFFPCITKPTRLVPDKRPSLLDHIFTNSLPNTVKSGICLYPIADGHLPVFCVSNSKPNKLKKNVIIRDYKKFREEEFLRHLELAFSDFQESTNDINDVNVLYDKFHSVFSKILNQHAPLKKLSQRQQKIFDKPWLTRGLLKSIKNKALMHKTHFLFGDIIQRKFYKTYCNILKRCIEMSKINYYQSSFNNLKNDTKKIWKKINEIVNIKSSSSSSPNLIKVNQQNITDPKIMANHFNEFFRNIGPTLANQIAPTIANFNDYLHNPVTNVFHFTPTNPDEINSLVINLKPTNAEGLDYMPTKIIKISSNIISEHLSKIFNLSLSTGVFPDMLKEAKIFPIYKADKRILVENYRPISILSPFSKIIERLIFNRLIIFLNENKILYDYQFGFRRNHSTELALVEISDQIYKSLDNSDFFFALYLDLSKAFDTVDHFILLEKLQYYGIKNNELKWFKSYLSNRTQRVDIDGTLSDPLLTICGVPQGSILGPLLFLLYINDLPNSSTKLNFRLFADDTKIYFSHSSLIEIQNLINTEIPKITNWLAANKLSPNLSKTKYVLFKSPNKIENIVLSVKLANREIERKLFAKHLGLLFDFDMSWKSQCKAVSLKISRAVGILFKLKNYVNQKILRNVYFALVYSHLNYGILSWGAACPSYLQPIQIKQNLFLKVMLKLDMMHNTDRLYFGYKFFKINEIYHNKCLTLTHSHYHGLLPPAFYDFRTPANVIHDYPTRYALEGNFHLEPIHNNYGLKSPSYTGNRLWSQIPFHTKNFSPTNFKKFLFDYLISRYNQ